MATPGENPEKKMAWISVDEAAFYVSAPKDSVRSPIRELIERIYHAESLLAVSRARSILRERIYANYSATIAERETVKVAAKRLSAPADRPMPAHAKLLPEAIELPLFEVEGLTPGMKVTRAEIPGILERLKKETSRVRAKWASDRAVSVLLLNHDDRLVAYAWNSASAIRTRHAEANLCEKLRTLTAEGRIPRGAKLYVSLKPCRMCAARIWESAADPAHLSVTYFENDPGPLAQGTLLEARSPARVRYLGLDHPLFETEISKIAR